MSKWLIIGASSFTGSHFCEYLRQRGDKVTKLSLRGDWATMLIGADYVVDFAALNVVAPSWGYPADYMRVNVMEHITLWNTFISDGMPGKWVHVSTPEVYGSTQGYVLEDNSYNPSTPYAVSRAAAEMILKCYHKQHGLPIVFTRSCNVYGPGQQLYRLIPKLIVSIKKGQRFPLEGGGASKRAFLHVDDVCKAIYLAAIYGEAGSAYHISSTNLQSISNIVAMICSAMKVSFDDVVQLEPERPGKDEAYLLNPGRICALGWKQEIELPAGIRTVIDWVDEQWEGLKDQPLQYEFRP